MERSDKKLFTIWIVPAAWTCEGYEINVLKKQKEQSDTAVIV